MLSSDNTCGLGSDHRMDLQATQLNLWSLLLLHLVSSQAEEL